MNPQGGASHSAARHGRLAAHHRTATPPSSCSAQLQQQFEGIRATKYQGRRSDCDCPAIQAILPPATLRPLMCMSKACITQPSALSPRPPTLHSPSCSSAPAHKGGRSAQVGDPRLNECNTPTVSSDKKHKNNGMQRDDHSAETQAYRAVVTEQGQMCWAVLVIYVAWVA